MAVAAAVAVLGVIAAVFTFAAGKPLIGWVLIACSVGAALSGALGRRL